MGEKRVVVYPLPEMEHIFIVVDIALCVSLGGHIGLSLAARHPDRTTALLLDTAILQPFEPPISALERAALESSFVVWLSYRMARSRGQVPGRGVTGAILTSDRSACHQ